jgi:uncharacterized repeat protein (TIGR03943 family)
MLIEFIVHRRRVVVVFAWAYVLLGLLANQRYTAFLRPQLGWLLGGAVMLLMVFLIAEIGRPREEERDLMLLVPATIILIPLLFLRIAQGGSLDRYAFQKRVVGIPSLSSSNNQNNEQKIKEKLVISDEPNASQQVDGKEKNDIVRASSKVLTVSHRELYEIPKMYEGKEVSLMGMVESDKEIQKQFGKNFWILFRFVVTCCVADAQPLSVLVESSSIPLIDNDNAWVKVRGRFSVKREGEIEIPLVKASEVHAIKKPDEEYLY